MSVQLTGTGVGALVGIIVVGGIVYYVYTHRKELFEAVNPMSNKNLASKTADRLTQYITGDPTDTLGGKIFDILNPGVNKQIEDMLHGNVMSTVPGQVTPNVPGSGNTTVPGWEGNPMGLAGWTPTVDPKTGRMMLTPPLTPTTWLIIAGASLALYAHKKSRRRGRRR